MLAAPGSDAHAWCMLFLADDRATRHNGLSHGRREQALPAGLAARPALVFSCFFSFRFSGASLAIAAAWSA